MDGAKPGLYAIQYETNRFVANSKNRANKMGEKKCSFIGVHVDDRRECRGEEAGERR